MRAPRVVGALIVTAVSGLALAQVAVKELKPKPKPISIPLDTHRFPLKLDPKARPLTSAESAATSAGSMKPMLLLTPANTICQTNESCEEQGLVLDPENCFACISPDGNCFVMVDTGGSSSTTGTLYWGNYTYDQRTGTYRLAAGTVYRWGSYDVGIATKSTASGGLGCTKIVSKIRINRAVTAPPITNKR